MSFFHSGGKLVPHFDTSSTWREVRILSRSDSSSGSGGGGGGPSTSNATAGTSSTCGPKSHPWDPSVIVRGDKKDKHSEIENEFIGSQGESMTRNSVVVRFKGQVDVMLSPLLLEGLQRYVLVFVNYILYCLL